MSSVATIDHTDWTATPDREAAVEATQALEAGNVVLLPELGFAVESGEASFFTPAILDNSKNASFDPASGRLGGTTAKGRDAETLRRFIQRFSESAAALVNRVLPRYRDHLTRGSASFRPAEIAGRATTWRKDDSRLHVDSFPATPSGGRRILRVFSNVNPEGRARAWRIGGEFETVARRFAPELRLPLPGTGHVLSLLRVTKTRRSPQTASDFPAGSTWIAFTDQVSHAATAGQYQLEQTFLVPVQTMLDEQRSPLRILERLK